MPFSDSLLDSLATSRDISKRQREQRRTWLDTCHERITCCGQPTVQRIDWLSSEGDQLYRQMVDAFEPPKSAFSGRDHGGAASWAAQGRQHKARLQEVNAEKRRLIDVMKAAQAEFVKARDDYRKIKVEHERAHERFNERLNYLKQQSSKDRARLQEQREAETRQRVAERQRSAADRDHRRSAVQQRRAEFVDVARRRARQLNTRGPRTVQARDDDLVVKVKNGYDRRSDTYTTDIIIGYRDRRIPFHYHFVIDEHGHVIKDEERPNS